MSGSTSAMGLEICNFLWLHGFEIITLSRGEHVSPDIEPHKHHAYQADFRDASAVDDALNQIQEKWRYLPYIINCAGLNVPGKQSEISWVDVDESIRVNAMSSFLVSSRFVSTMTEVGFGRIVNVTSGAPLNCFAGFTAYSVGKAALNALTVTLAKETNSANVRVNLFSPGPVRSRMNPKGVLSAESSMPTLTYLLHQSNDLPTGRFFWRGHEVPLFPDLSAIDWLSGQANSLPSLPPLEGSMFP